MKHRPCALRYEFLLYCYILHVPPARWCLKKAVCTLAQDYKLTTLPSCSLAAYRKEEGAACRTAEGTMCNLHMQYRVLFIFLRSNVRAWLQVQGQLRRSGRRVFLGLCSPIPPGCGMRAPNGWI